jgi:hypothetical protein
MYGVWSSKLGPSVYLARTQGIIAYYEFGMGFIAQAHQSICSAIAMANTIPFAWGRSNMGAQMETVPHGARPVGCLQKGKY